MTFDYHEPTDTMWVSISEPASLCVYVESDTPGVVLRVEECSGIIRGYEVTAWRRRLAKGALNIPEAGSDDFVKEWIATLPERVGAF
jgi:hypothetical protein